jgi:hypothetical protein
MSKKDPPGYPGDDAIKKAFGEAVRHIREEKGLSLEEAEALVKQAAKKVDIFRAARALGIVVRRLREQQKLTRCGTEFSIRVNAALHYRPRTWKGARCLIYSYCPHLLRPER